MSDKQHDERDEQQRDQPVRFKPGQAVRVDGVIYRVDDPCVGELRVDIKQAIRTGGRGSIMTFDASAVHLASGDGERGYRALTLLRELVIGEEFAGDEYPERFRKFVSEICDLARPLIAEQEKSDE